MKVIEKGREQKGWAKKFKCTGEGNHGGGCGARLLVEQDDIFCTYSSHYDGSTENYRTFECPECKCLTDIPKTIYLPFTPKRRNPNKPSRD